MKINIRALVVVLFIALMLILSIPFMLIAFVAGYINMGCLLYTSMENTLKFCFIAIVKEALNNVIKHSNAVNVWIRIKEFPEFYQLVIKDNGNMIEYDKDKGIGLQNMEAVSYTHLGMDALMEGRTVFVIAHRLSTVKNSDVIIVLDHGHIIERGSHEELIEKKGQYYQLYTGAFELE